MTEFEGPMAPGHEEWAVLCALGSMTAAEQSAFEKHLATGCVVCSRDLRATLATVGELALAADPVRPPAGLRERLLSRARSELAERPGNSPEQPGIVLDRNGLLIVRSSSMEWIEGPMPGIRLKRLSNNRVKDRHTLLVEMKPGTRYPRHRHAAAEELYLLAGDLCVEGVRMGPGDYCRGEAGTVHGEVRSEFGAIFVVTASNRDEILTSFE